MLEKLFNLFRPVAQDKLYNFGVLEDTRTDEEKAKDWLASEHVAIAGDTSDPYKNTKITESEYADENQYGSSACVPHAIGTATETAGEPRPSHLLFYRKRSNFSAEGCFPWEMMDMASKYKLPAWEANPTPRGATEAYANSLPNLPLIKRDRPLPYYSLRNAEEIAKAANLNRGVPITIFATVAEWSKEYVDVIDNDLNLGKATIRHEVMVLPMSPFRDENGVPRLTVVDSAPFGGLKIRHPSADFINTRMYNPGYAFIDTKPEKKTYKYPKYSFKKIIRYGDKTNDVLMFQKVLCAQGLLSADNVIGVFGPKTLKALYSFRLKNLGKEYVGTTYVGKDTLAILNNLCY